MIVNTPDYFHELADQSIPDKVAGSLVYPMIFFPAIIHGIFGGPQIVYKSKNYSPMLSIDPFNATGWKSPETNVEN